MEDGIKCTFFNCDFSAKEQKLKAFDARKFESAEESEKAGIVSTFRTISIVDVLRIHMNYSHGVKE